MQAAILDTDILSEIIELRDPVVRGMRSITRNNSEPFLSRLWAYARTNGYPHKDADLVIAATALNEGVALATGNTSDFAWVPGLTIEDWRTP
jgi:hypothetical protein